MNPVKIIPASTVPILPVAAASPPPGAFLPEAVPLSTQVYHGEDMEGDPEPELPDGHPQPELVVKAPEPRRLIQLPAGFSSVQPAAPSLAPTVQQERLVQQEQALIRPVQTLLVRPAGFASALTPESSSLLADIFGLGGEESVNIDESLATVPGLTGGPSRGGFSWHTLELPMHCWRLAYYSLVLGLVPKRAQHALSFGSLYHACWEIWYKSGGARRYDEPCDAVRKAGAPKLAGAVQKLVYVELLKYAQEEATTWDIRAVEQNAVFWGEPERINGKLVYLPFSCRHDMLIGKRAPGAPCAPAGPLASGIWVVDRKCLHRDERIWDLRTSRRVRALDLQPALLLPSVDTVTNTLTSEPSLATDNGIVPTVRVRLASGRETLLTEEHPVLAANGLQQALRLEPGQYVACAPLTAVEGNDEISDEAAELLGYSMADCSFNPDSVQLESSRRDLMQRVEELARLVDGPNVELGEYAGRGNKKQLLTRVCRMAKGSTFYLLLQKWDLLGKRARAKFVPDGVLSSTKHQLAIFLAALWSADGAIYETTGRSLLISWSSASRGLARDVQQCLWRLGIWSTVRTFKKGTGRVIHLVTVTGHEDKQRFLATIAPRVMPKQEVELSLHSAEQLLAQAADDSDVIPVEVVARAVQRLSRAGGIKGKDGWLYLTGRSASRTVARNTLRAFVGAVPELQSVIDSPLRWDKVDSVTPLGIAGSIAISMRGDNPLFLTEDGIVTHNTASALTYDLTKGYGTDGQFLMNALVYQRSDEEREFGPFVGMIFAVAVKHKDPSPEKSYFRIETTVDAESLEEFHREELRPYAVELYRRLATPAVREDPRAWPKCRASCVGRYGVCRFFDICDVGGDGLIDAMFDVDPTRVFNLEKLAEPPMEAKRALRDEDPVRAAAEAVRKGKSDEKKHLSACVLETFRTAALGLPQFDTTLFLVPNHTRKTVLEQLVQALRTLWPEGFAFEMGPDGEGRRYALAVAAKAIRWVWSEQPREPDPTVEEEPKKRGRPRTHVHQVKGQMTFLAIAESICRDWWDPRHL